MRATPKGAAAAVKSWLQEMGLQADLNCKFHCANWYYQRGSYALLSSIG